VFHEGVDVRPGGGLGAGLAFGFGAHVPHLPGGPSGLDDVLCRLDDRCHRGGVHRGQRCHRAGSAGRQGGDQPGDGPVAAQYVGGLLAPLPALLGLGAGRVLGFPGLQGRLLGQFDRLDRGRWAAVRRLEGRRELRPADVDQGAAGRPGGEQLRRDAHDLAHGAPAAGDCRGGVGAFGEPQTEAAVQLGLDAGVVPLGRGDGRLVQHPPVQSQPPPWLTVRAGGADLGGDGDVGV